MEFPTVDSSGSSPLPPEPPDPDLDVMMPVVPHVPPVPPDPPPALLVCAFLRQISPFVITSLQRKEPEAPMPWFLCASTRFSLMFLCSDAEAWVEILVAGFLGLLIADCKLTFLYCSSVQGLEDWTSNGEIQEVVCFLNAAITTMQPFGVQLPAAMCRLQTKKILHLKHGFHVAGSKFHCFKLSQEESEEELLMVPDMEAAGSTGVVSSSADDGANNQEIDQTHNGTSNAKRPRGRTPADKEYRSLKRLLRNRVSAQQARERKKVYVSDLESRANELQNNNDELEEKISTLMNENTMLRKMLINTRPKADENH